MLVPLRRNSRLDDDFVDPARVAGDSAKCEGSAEGKTQTYLIGGRARSDAREVASMVEQKRRSVRSRISASDLAKPVTSYLWWDGLVSAHVSTPRAVNRDVTHSCFDAPIYVSAMRASITSVLASPPDMPLSLSFSPSSSRFV